MSRPVLHVFHISHYCEKARWALEACGIDFELRQLMVGSHRRIAAQRGASAGTLPFLSTDQGVVSGSAAIVDWCEATSLTPPAPWRAGETAGTRAKAQRLDDVVGVHVRRFYYSDALFSMPAAVRPLFSQGLPWWQDLLVTLGWSRIVPKMRKGMDLGPAQGLESRAALARELDWLDGLLADGRPYLCGEHWSRADLTAASLLAPLVAPPEHPTIKTVAFPAQVRAAMNEWAQRPILRHVAQCYARHRGAPSAAF